MTTRSCRARRFVAWPGIALVAVLLVGCSSGAGEDNKKGSTAGGSSSSPSSASTSSSQPPQAGATPPKDLCGDPAVPSAQTSVIKTADGSRIPVAVLGKGPTTAVFFHQTNSGYCGFWSYAAWLTSHFPVRAVLIDLCGYGLAACSDTLSPNQRLQAQRIVTWARAQAPAPKRVVLVGASMGGAVALASTAITKANAVVDLSGPPDWSGSEAAKYAPSVQVPALVISSPDDSSTNFSALRAQFNRIPGKPKRFITGDGRHGWDLLAGSTSTSWDPAATIVARWITGTYS